MVDKYIMLVMYSREQHENIVGCHKLNDSLYAEDAEDFKWVKHEDHLEALKMERYNYDGAMADCRDLQTKLDALMFEYCPEDMTKEQLEEYEIHQEMTDFAYDVLQE